MSRAEGLIHHIGEVEIVKDIQVNEPRCTSPQAVRDLEDKRTSEALAETRDQAVDTT